MNAQTAYASRVESHALEDLFDELSQNLTNDFNLMVAIVQNRIVSAGSHIDPSNALKKTEEKIKELLMLLGLYFIMNQIRYRLKAGEQTDLAAMMKSILGGK